MFSKGRLCLSHVRSQLCTQTTRALLCVGEWSRLDLVAAEDLNSAALLPDLDEEEELSDGWDRIAERLAL